MEVIVKRHLRRRKPGRTADVAALLGIENPTVNVRPFRRKRPGTKYRHRDDGTYCGDVLKEERMFLPDKCPHGRPVDLV